MFKALTVFAYGASPNNGQVLSSSTNPQTGAVPSWFVFVGVSAVLAALVAAYFYFRFKRP